MTWQISIFLENKIGHFERVTRILREASVNIRSMTINNTVSGWGILNLVVDQPERGCEALVAGGVSATLREIIVLRMEERPGGLDDILQKLAAAAVNFDNAYGINHGKYAFLIVDAGNIPDARAKLKAVGVEPLTPEESYLKN
jgi:ACT domain-containing protein